MLFVIWLTTALLIANCPSTVLGQVSVLKGKSAEGNKSSKSSKSSKGNKSSKGDSGGGDSRTDDEIRNPGDFVLLWNDQALAEVRSLRLGAFDAVRTYAILNVAMFDAANGLDGPDSNFKYALIEPAPEKINGNKIAAISAAASTVLSELFPDNDFFFKSLLQDISIILTDAGENPKKIKRGEKWGSRVAENVIDIRSNDGSTPKKTLTGGDSPGQFRNDFGSAAFRNMDSFVVDNPLNYVSGGPPSPTSPEYLAAHSEVRLLGNAAYANTEYEEIYSFWKAGGGTVRPPGEWIKIAKVLAKQQGTIGSVTRTTFLFGSLSIALADASVSVAFDKSTHQFWRPTTAIQNADTDGNADTIQDSTWQPRNGSPGSSPEHTSGQSAFAGAASTILAEFFGNDNIQFTAEGDNSISGGRTYSSFSDAAREAGRSRIFSGIHFEFSNQAGQATGRAIAREVIEKLEI